MKYTFQDKVLTIPDEWIIKTEKALNLSKDEVIVLWLEDNDYLQNDEKEALIEKTKGQKIKHEAKGKTERKKRTVTKKENPDKKRVIDLIFNTLTKEGFQNVKIENETKIVTFSIDEVNYKIDLVQKRKPKE